MRRLILLVIIIIIIILKKIKIGKHLIKNISKIFNSINFIYKLSLTGKIINAYYNKEIILPKLQNIWENSNYYIVWKINIWYSNSSAFIKFIIKTWMEVSLVV